MKKKLFLFHTACFVGIFLVVSGFVFYQTFVTKQGQKVPLFQFLKPTTLLSAAKQLTHHEIGFNDQAFFWRDENTIQSVQRKGLTIKANAASQIFFVDSKKYLTELSSEELLVTDLETQEKKSFPLESSSEYTILGWTDATHPILTKKNAIFQIIELDLDVPVTTILVDQVQYEGPALPVIAGKIKTLIYPECTPKCSFLLFDLEKKQVVQRLPIFTDAGHEASVSDPKLLFFDEAKGYIGYEVLGRKEVFIIDRNLNLLQLIRLQNDRDTAEYLDYYPQTEQLLFSLKENDGSTQSIALVRASTPSLHMLTKTEPQEVLSSPKAGVYQIGNTFYDLNGKSLLQEASTLVTAY